MKKLLEINIGDIFGDLQCVDILIKQLPNGSNSTYYKMRCLKCGREKDMLSSTIRLEKGITHRACGKGLKTLDPIFYNRWQGMRTRTTNPNYEHANCYSGRGIDSEEFKYFIDFYDAMYESFIEKANEIGKNNTSLERINFNKGYTKENCTWIHKNEQQGNTRTVVHFIAIFPDGHSEIHKNVNKFANEHGLDANTILDAMNGRISQHRGYKFIRLQRMVNIVV